MDMVKKLAALVYGRLEQCENKKGCFLNNTAVREDLKILYPMQDVTGKQREFEIEKISLGILVFLAGSLLGVMLIIKGGREGEIDNNRLQRNSYGEGACSIELIAENGEETAQISLELEEKNFSIEELEKCYETFFEKLERVVLGKNSSFEEVVYDLVLPDCLEGYPFVLEWQTDEDYIDAKGRLVQNELSCPVVTEVTVRIAHDGFEREESFLCCVQSRASPVSMQEMLEKRLQVIEEENREKEFLMLPTEYGGKEIVWKQQRDWRGFLFLLAVPFVCAMLCFSKDRDLHKRVEEREEQMKMDYPELVSRLALLLGAGMTVQNAWERIAFDYAGKKPSEAGKRYVYEEMLLTVHEWKNGVYQSEALEGFGRRCRLACYNKLATLLVQNLRSGSTNLAVLLQEEAVAAFEERKHLARRQGEKAGTKLLFPMMLLLMIVMVIIIVPTFITI